MGKWYHIAYKSAEEAGGEQPNVVNAQFGSDDDALAVATALEGCLDADYMSTTVDVRANRDRSTYPAYTGIVDAGLLLGGGDGSPDHPATSSQHYRLFNVSPTGNVKAALRGLIAGGTFMLFNSGDALSGVVNARR